jgi:signal transduction histidine kinase
MKRKILFIDDEEDFLKGIRRSLRTKRDEWQLEFAAGGDKALKAIQSGEIPDLIVCDLMMPGLSGFELLQKLRVQPETQIIPFIFLTGKGDKNSFRQGMAMGADDFLTKPFETADLIQAIQIRLIKKDLQSTHTEQKLNQLCDSIVLAIPHELRTPLTVIQGFSEFILSAGPELSRQEIKTMVQYIQDSTRRLNRIIENYLTYIRIDMFSKNQQATNMLGSFHFEFPGQIVSDLARRVASTWKRLDDVIAEVDNIPIQIAEEDFKKIVEELLDNGLKFSKPETRVRVSSTLKDKKFVIKFWNEGRGMSDEQIAEIGIFRQFDRKIHEQQGAGLGLIIAKRLAELYGGNLTITSTPNKFVEVCVTFNAVNASEVL